MQGALLDKYRKYKRHLIINAFAVIASIGLMVAVMDKDPVVIPTIPLSIYGFFMLPIMPTSYQFGVELTFGLGEALTVGLFQMMIDVYSIIYSVLVTSLLSNYESPTPANLAIGATAVAGAIAALFLKEDLQKTNYERARKEKMLQKMREEANGYKRQSDDVEEEEELK